jgi:hypothetical protein
MKIKRLLDLACIALGTSVVLDPLLWVTKGYLVPSWTIGALSGGIIGLIQAIKWLLK